MISIQDRNIVDENGKTKTPMMIWMEQVTNLQIATGSGTPEGQLEALPTKLYMDTTGAAGAVLYVKRDADIVGDTAKGWILV